MIKVAVRLDALLRDAAEPSEKHVVRIAAASSLSGIDSLVATLPETGVDDWLKPLTLAKTVFDGPFVVACSGSTDHLNLIHKLRPDLVVLTSANFTPLLSEDLVGPNLRSTCESLDSSGVGYGLFVETRVTDVKDARKLNADLVVFPVDGVVSAETSREVSSSVEMLETAAIAADKLGLRVLLAGGLDRTSWKSFDDMGLIEGAIIGSTFTDRALLLGLQHAVRELRV